MIFIWVATFIVVAVAVYILFPPTEHNIVESFEVSDTHRPEETYRYLRYKAKMEKLQPYLKAFGDEKYEAVFLSMYPLESFEENDFLDYRGVSVLKVELVLENSMELMGALDILLSGEELPERIYLGIDPVMLEQHLVWEEDLDWQDTIVELLGEQEEITWEVLLAYPSWEEWQSMSNLERVQGIESYGRAMDALVSLENVLTFYIGGQEWLICNQDNYVGEGLLNTNVTHALTREVFCDQRYMVTGDNRKGMLKELEDTLESWQYVLSNMREWEDSTFVFLGDSIFGNYTDSTSVSSVVERFTGAKCINCGYGGICLSAGGWVGMSGMDVITNLCSGQVGDISKGVAAYEGVQEFSQIKQEKGRLIFFLNYGINDYMQGHPVESEDKYDTLAYAGAMRVGIERLQTAYPGAEVVVLTPGYITYWDNGSLVVNETGGTLETYVEAAMEVAGEYGLPYMNIYDKLERCAQEEDLLYADGVHLNGKGRFNLGLWICEKINN